MAGEGGDSTVAGAGEATIGAFAVEREPDRSFEPLAPWAERLALDRFFVIEKLLILFCIQTRASDSWLVALTNR